MESKKTSKPARVFIKHITGQYLDGVQYCSVCGELIIDNRNELKSFPFLNVRDEGEDFWVSIKGGSRLSTIFEPNHWENCVVV